MKHRDINQKLTVSAREPFHIYYDGPANLVSAQNQVGKFDILPGHADFFSVMTPGDVTIETDNGPINFQISSGVITVRSDEAQLFVNF